MVEVEANHGPISDCFTGLVLLTRSGSTEQNRTAFIRGLLHDGSRFHSSVCRRIGFCLFLCFLPSYGRLQILWTRGVGAGANHVQCLAAK